MAWFIGVYAPLHTVDAELRGVNTRGALVLTQHPTPHTTCCAYGRYERKTHGEDSMMRARALGGHIGQGARYRRVPSVPAVPDVDMALDTQIGSQTGRLLALPQSQRHCMGPATQRRRALA